MSTDMSKPCSHASTVNQARRHALSEQLPVSRQHEPPIANDSSSDSAILDYKQLLADVCSKPEYGNLNKTVSFEPVQYPPR